MAMSVIPFIICFISFSSLFPYSCHAVTDTLTASDTLRDGQTLISAGGVFVLGFFVDASSGNHYLGIWLRADASQVVWVAFREVPLLDSTGVLQIRTGNLFITDRRQLQLIVNAGTVAATANTSATLLDTGNLVLKDANTGTIIWQSFDVPTDTYLPGMKLGLFGLNTTNQQSFRILTSWLSPQNPSRGLFTLSVDRFDFMKMDVWRGDGLQMHIASWDGDSLRFIFDNTTANDDYNFSYRSINGSEAYYTFSHNKKYDLMWFVMASNGNLEEYFMVKGKISNVSHALCEDSKGGNSGTCLTSLPPMCGDTFSQRTGSFPSTVKSESINIGDNDCETLCKSNCSCSAFVSFVSTDQSDVCQLYYGSQQDLMKAMEGGTRTINFRGSATTNDGNKKLKLWLTIALPVVFLSVLIILFVLCYLCWTSGPKGSRREAIVLSDEVRLFQIASTNASPIQYNLARVANLMELSRSQKDQDLPFFTFAALQTATNDFAKANKLGEGGFGPVYKGKLSEGQEIAVKRLSELSRQGLEEFKNEVLVICKLQHRNLVRILGCCIEGEESILVYEYMPNKSLDSFIFDSAKRGLLDWKKRKNIIEGISQGLLYLHKYSRVRIIHRDLKTSNILLDNDMTPKISDFGMARIFGDNDTRGKTNRVVGTFGYMSPEYAMGGLFSEKSDVFSFGVILLELISGKKNIPFFESDQASLNLLGNAWNLWNEGNSMELVDPTLLASCESSEVMRCIQMGLLCVQERAMDRPYMSDVVSMLSNHSFPLPLPKEPAFWSQLSSTDADSSSSRQRHYSTIESTLTISDVHGR